MDAIIPPELLIWNDRRLMRLRYEVSTCTYTRDVETTLSSPIKTTGLLALFPSAVRERFFSQACYIIKTVSLAGDIYVGAITSRDAPGKGDSYIFRFDSHLNCVKWRVFKSIGDLVIDDSRMLVAAEGGLVVLDRNLKDLGRVQLWGSGRFRSSKNAHDILVFGERAYLLDNIFFPVCVLDVSVKDLERMAVNRCIKLGGIYPHLSHQWLDPDLQKWFVILSSMVNARASQALLVFSMPEGDQPVASQMIWEQLFAADKTEEGLEIISTTQLPPLLAVVRNSHHEYSLSRIKTSDQGVEFEGILTLQELSQLHRRDIVAQFSGQFLFVIANNTLRILNVEASQPVVVASADLGLYGMDYNATSYQQSLMRGVTIM